ncbi:DUF5131 family protein [Candidatus Sumerlaeota bacterium]
MAQPSKIEWTEITWNPVTGCTKTSAGCQNCYAERMAKRLQGMKKPKYSKGFQVTIHPEILDEPRHWRKPRLVFVVSMGDLFHKKVPLSFVRKVFAVMNECPQHTFQLLTKRPHIAAECAGQLRWTDNIWIGATVEDRKSLSRIAHVRKIPAAVRFLSLEPLIERLPRLPLSKIDWVIVGGESGPGSRPMEKDWVRNIRDRCVEKGVPFFFKQWGGVNKKKTGRELDGRIWDEMPISFHGAEEE